MKHFILPLTACFTLIAQGAISGQFKNVSVQCYFFKAEKLEIKDTCISNGVSWTGGGGHSLKWSDGITTTVKFGLHGRGTPICKEKSQTNIDGVCGESYHRSVKTLKRTTNMDDSIMNCVQLKKKSVCWKF